jgi:hypothetical protein
VGRGYRRYVDKIDTNTILLLSSIPCHWNDGTLSPGPLQRGQFCEGDRQEQARSRSYQHVSVLRELVVFGCQVHMEQDSPGTDGG